MTLCVKLAIDGVLDRGNKLSSLDLGVDIPSEIDTYEKLFLWAALALNSVNRGVLYKETADPNGAVEVASVGVVFTSDGTDRAICRVSIPLNPDWRSQSQSKFWTQALEISNTIVPAAFNAN